MSYRCCRRPYARAVVASALQIRRSPVRGLLVSGLFLRSSVGGRWCFPALPGSRLPQRACDDRDASGDYHQQAHDLVRGQAPKGFGRLAQELGQETKDTVTQKIEGEQSPEQDLSSPECDQ